MENDKMVRAKEVYIKSDPSSGKMVILKEDAEAKRYFLMFVGDAEFAAIAKEQGLVDPRRPLTHQLYLSIIDKLPVEFVRVEITHMKEDTFFASVVFNADGVEHRMDSRPSDGVALALNRKIPIMVNEKLFRRELTQEEIEEYEGIVKTIKF
ncbi:MAG: bifunctional nuclease family protein [Deltaproteobacteria bacterium]|nr:bifunctional nuclease family protein [Deltaproteobacteria bacterium]MBW2136224.1 bifunctional nuclease family protein [Deltaproteobacteria bacterium]